MGRRIVPGAKRRARLGPPGPADRPLRPCVGCGAAPVRGPTYCRICRDRIRRGLPTDLDDLPTLAECRRIGAGGVP